MKQIGIWIVLSGLVCAATIHGLKGDPAPKPGILVRPVKHDGVIRKIPSRNIETITATKGETRC